LNQGPRTLPTTAVALREALQRLNNLVADVHQAAANMSSASGEIAQGNHA